MDSISITQLRTNPASAIRESLDYPLAIKKGNKVEAYLIGKDLYDNIESYLEDIIDRKAVEDTDFSKGKDFELI